MNPLSSRYLGFDLKNPIVASASPLSQTLSGIRQLEDAGVGAIVMYSLFEEQIRYEHRHTDGPERPTKPGEPESYFPDMDGYNLNPDGYLDLVAKAKEAVDIPLIASLNGMSAGDWIGYSSQLAEAGADAIELNLYYIPTDPSLTGTEVEELYVDVVHEVRKKVRIPLAVKIGPQFSAPANMAFRLAMAGANGLVLFNRFYQPDLDIARLEVVPRLVLSDSHELRLPLRWVAILYGRISVDFAITTGVHTYEDVLKAMMAGANVTMMASEFLQHGLGRAKLIETSMIRWMEEFEYRSLTQMRGSLSQRNITDPTAFERANYMKVLDSLWTEPERLVA